MAGRRQAVSKFAERGGLAIVLFGNLHRRFVVTLALYVRLREELTKLRDNFFNVALSPTDKALATTSETARMQCAQAKCSLLSKGRLY